MVGRQSVFVAQENSKSRFGNEKASCCDHIEISIGNLSTLRVQIGNQVKRDFLSRDSVLKGLFPCQLEINLFFSVIHFIHENLYLLAEFKAFARIPPNNRRSIRGDAVILVSR